jgi:glutathione synthase/RimK-type ligase-like ATP-grasp enzyme
VRRVAFVTHQDLPEITDDDRLTAEILKSRGVAVCSAVWSDDRASWSEFSSVVVRSAWDYHLRTDAYARWLRRCSAEAVNLHNPPAAVLANLHKRYLVELGRQGIPVVPTTCLPAAIGRQLRPLLEEHGWSEAVVKPAVSASAWGTWRTSFATADRDQERFAAQTSAQDILIQPYVREIEQGKWSLVFFAGAFSHAVLKVPAPGEFRVHREFGGQAKAADPSAGLIDQAQSVLATLGCPLLYARVDGIERDGRLLLTELEINEPFLFLGWSPEAAGRFAEAILTTL